MAPKNKDSGKSGSAAGKGKGKGKDDEATAGGSGKLKAAQSINVRHILCEKHSKKEEALAKLRDGAKFDDVAREFSEDKARQGGALGWKVRGSLHGDFEKVAYDLEPSTTTNPKCKFLILVAESMNVQCWKTITCPYKGSPRSEKE